MVKYLDNKRGVTLIELLAVLVISSIIVVLIMNIFSTGQKQYKGQTIKSEQLNDVRYAAKVITKEIRKAEKLIWDGTTLSVGTVEPLKIKNDSNEIRKNGKLFISNIKVSKMSLIDHSLKLTIESINTKSNKQQSLEIEIFIREGVIIE